MTLDQLAADIHANAVTHGFWDGERNFGEAIALIHAELSEALEQHRSGSDLVYGESLDVDAWAHEEGMGQRFGNEVAFSPDGWLRSLAGERCKPEGTAVELVDVLIRTLDLLAGIGVTNIDQIVAAKMAYNATRPRLHGKRY